MVNIGEISAQPLKHPADFDPLLDQVTDTQYALIGEASHGTHEFYDWRGALTQRLIAEKAFSGIAIEADQPICGLLDRCVRLMPDAPDDPEEILAEYSRWPDWLLANGEMVKFLRWLREYNQEYPTQDRVQIHGLDGYPLWSGVEAILDHLSDTCRWPSDRVNHALDAPLRGEPMATPEVVGAAVSQLIKQLPENSKSEAAAYYQELFGGDAMRARTQHWLGRLGLLAAEQKRQSGMVVWAHNTHVHDTRKSDAAFESLGQGLKERYGSRGVMLIGQLGGSGEVTAAHERGAQKATMSIPPPRAESLEAQLAEKLPNLERALVIPNQQQTERRIGHRAIGAVHNPHDEFYMNIDPRCYDALLWHATMTSVHGLQRHITPKLLRRQ